MHAREFYPSASTAGLDSEEATPSDEMRHLRALASVKSMEVSVSVSSWCFHLIRTMHTHADISVPSCCCCC